MEDIELLGHFFEADRIAGDRQTYVLTYTGGMPGPVWVGVRGWPDDVPAPSEHRLDDLAERGWLRIDERRQKTRKVVLTPSGQDAWTTHVAEVQRRPRPVDLSWPAVSETLKQILRLYEEQGAPPLGAWVGPLTEDTSNGHNATAHVDSLLQGGYLALGRAGAGGPTHVKPTDLTLQMYAGWPAGSAQAALDELVHDVDVEIERSPNEERRSKLEALRSALVGAGRDVALAYFEKKVGL